MAHKLQSTQLFGFTDTDFELIVTAPCDEAINQ